MRASAVDPMFEVVSIRPSGSTLLVSGSSKPGTNSLWKANGPVGISEQRVTCDMTIGSIIVSVFYVVNLLIQGPEWLFLDIYGRTFNS